MAGVDALSKRTYLCGQSPGDFLELTSQSVKQGLFAYSLYAEEFLE